MDSTNVKIQTMLRLIFTWLRQVYDPIFRFFESSPLCALSAVRKILIVSRSSYVTSAKLCIIFRLQVSTPNSNSATQIALHKWRWRSQGQGITKVQNTNILWAFNTGFLLIEGSIQNSVMNLRVTSLIIISCPPVVE
jgi:hypothetical protein